MSISVFSKINSCLVAMLILAQSSALPAANRPSEASDLGAPKQALIVSPVFAFSGALATGAVATTVHCSNTGGTSVSVSVQLFDFDDSSTTIASGTIQSGRTRTTSFSSGNAATTGTVIYSEDDYIDTAADDINQGRGLISVDPVDAPVICTAQILESNAATPNFIVDLPLYRVDASGNPVGP